MQEKILIYNIIISHIHNIFLIFRYQLLLILMNIPKGLDFPLQIKTLHAY